MNASDRRSAWLIVLIAAAVIAGIAVVLALIFGSIHILIIAALVLVPVLLLAGLLYLVTRSNSGAEAGVFDRGR